MDTNDGYAFPIISEVGNERKGKKKEITCYKCKKTGHYVNKCDEEDNTRASNKNGSNFLVPINDKYDSSSDYESNDYAQGNNHDNFHRAIIRKKGKSTESHDSDDEQTTDDDDATTSDDEEYGGFASI